MSLSLFVIGGITSTAMALDKQVVAGAGPSTKVVELFFSKFCLQPCAQGYEFVVPPMSTKHAGGIKNSGQYLFGRTGRPLNSKELGLNKKEIYLAKVPIAFAMGDGSKIRSLSMDQVKKIFLGEISNWKELGGPDVDIVTVGREPTEALFTELKGEYPFFKDAKFDVIYKKDHQVVEFLKSPVGQFAIAFGAEPNFSEVSTLEIDGGFEAGVRLGLVYDQTNQDHPLIKAASDYAKTDEWHNLVAQASLIPAQ